MDNVDQNLKRSREMLKHESGGEWLHLVRAFGDAAYQLPEEPSKDDFKRMLEQIRDPLGAYSSGRSLLEVIVAIVDDEIGAWESPAQKKNRFRKLFDVEDTKAAAA